jgi:hypothetical protein
MFYEFFMVFLRLFHLLTGKLNMQVIRASICFLVLACSSNEFPSRRRPCERCHICADKYR